MTFKLFSSSTMHRLRDRFRRMYGERGDQCLRRLAMLAGRYGVGGEMARESEGLSERDVVLVTYGDMIQDPSEKPLATLQAFLSERLSDVVNTVHILPFFPYSSDDGFSVIDYRKVREALGDWDNIRALGERFHIMADLVLNHTSKKSDWFRRYTAGIAPERHYFIEVDPAADLASVVRPRDLPLLTPVRTDAGERHVWTTFSADQVDLNFANPDVLFEFLDILFLYIANGVKVIRLDAIAYLWKEIGTPCIHLWQTHEVVKIIRDVLAMVAPDVLLITETNVPHEQNIIYFGDGDEAHMVYQFTLPPLLLHAIEAGDSGYLNEWLATSGGAPPGCSFLNFTASHDGIGVRPLEGIVPEEELEALLACVNRRGGQVSYRARGDGGKTPYEMNITYFDAFADPADKGGDLHVQRFLCSQAVAMSLSGVPAVYFHSLFGTGNDLEGVKRTGRARSINRRKLVAKDLNAKLDDPASVESRVFNAYRNLLKVRIRQPAFHPAGAQRVLDMGPSVFAVERRAPDGMTALLALSNFTAQPQTVSLEKSSPALKYARVWRDCISGNQLSCTKNSGGDRVSGHKTVTLAPYQTMWLVPENGHPE